MDTTASIFSTLPSTTTPPSSRERGEFRPALTTIISAFLLALVIDHMLWGTLLGIGFPIMIVVILLVIGWLIRVRKEKIMFHTYLLAWSTLVVSTMVAIRESHLLTALNVIATFLLLMLTVRSRHVPKWSDISWGDLFLSAALPLETTVPLLHTAQDLVAMKGVGDAAKTYGKVVRGALFSLPILLVVGTLLISADAAFRQLVTDVLSFEKLMDTLSHVPLIVVATLFMTGLLGYTLSRTYYRIPMTLQTTRWLSLVESSIILWSLSLLLALFVIVQAKYLFGGHEVIQTLGITYAEYAHKGFAELILVALICWGILWQIDLRSELCGERKHSWLMKALSTILTLMVATIMVSAFLRLSVYIESYALTTLRLYVQVFIVFLAVAISLLALKVTLFLSMDQYARSIVLVSLIFLLAMNTLNPDAFIARYNLTHRDAFVMSPTGDTDSINSFSRSTPVQTIDTAYLFYLSTDATPVIAEHYFSGKIPLTDKALVDTRLRKLYAQLVVAEGDAGAWTATHFSRYHATQVLKKIEQMVALAPPLPMSR